MSIQFRANQFQPNIAPNRPQKQDENVKNEDASDNKCTINESVQIPPEILTQKLEQEIAQAEEQLKAKLDHYVKILEQLGEPTFTQSYRSGQSGQIIQGKPTITQHGSLRTIPGNPHVEGFAQLLNAPIPQKGSVSPEEGVKILKDRLAQLTQALQDIDNDIREATFRLLEQQNDAANEAINNSIVHGGGMASSQARLITYTRSN